VTIALDPGPDATQVCIFDGERVTWCAEVPNADLPDAILRGWKEGDRLACEMIVSYGQAVGESTFKTCEIIGVVKFLFPHVQMVRRVDVKKELTGTGASKDPQVRAALIDRVGPTGTKKTPGPTYGVSGHGWAALAVAWYAHNVQAKGKK
jgi:hypothetical protein